MANYTTKLVDHTDKTTENLLKAILKDTQSLFDEVFDGTKLQVAVSWGTAAGIDNYVAHFVDDKANSYLRKTWPRMTGAEEAGGHTHTDGSKSGSEIYKYNDSSRSQYRGVGYAKLILHEFFHNQFPFVKEDVHGKWGGGGLAAAVPMLGDPPNRINDRNKELIRQGFTVKTIQLL